jgi:hypothetical protein
MSDKDMGEVDKVWKEFWRPLVTRNGKVSLEQVKRELFDYHAMLEDVPKVYDHITEGRISKPNTCASAVISVADELYQQNFEEDWKEREKEAHDDHD